MQPQHVSTLFCARGTHAVLQGTRGGRSGLSGAVDHREFRGVGGGGVGSSRATRPAPAEGYG